MQDFAIVLVFSLAFGGLYLPQVEGAEWIMDQWGEYVIVPMKNAPFPHKTREQGHTYKDQFFPSDKHYQDNSVGILIPSGYQKGEKVDLLVHFHGWDNNVAHEIEQFDFRSQLFESRKNVIMVLPQGPRNASDSTCGKMEDPDGLKNLVNEVLDFLYKEKKTKTKSLGTLILSGHSGGYRPVAFSLDKGGLEEHIKEVFLLDATYDFLTIYAGWAARSGGRLISICTSHLLGENFELLHDLQQKGINHSKLFLDDDATTENLSQSRISFIYTRLGHLELVYERKYFARFLFTSSLQEIK